MKITVNLPQSFLLLYKEPGKAFKELVDTTQALELCNQKHEKNSGWNTKQLSNLEM